MKKTLSRQRGVVLIVSLIFLLLLSILVSTMIQTNTLQLQMAGNDEAKMESMQRALAIVDFIVDNAKNTPVTGDVGYRICAEHADPDIPVLIDSCDEYVIGITDVALLDEDSGVEVEYFVDRAGPLETAIPFMDESIVSSSTAFSVARQEITVRFDRTDQGGGVSTVSQGYLRLITSPGSISTGTEVVTDILVPEE